MDFSSGCVLQQGLSYKLLFFPFLVSEQECENNHCHNPLNQSSQSSQMEKSLKWRSILSNGETLSLNIKSGGNPVLLALGPIFFIKFVSEFVLIFLLLVGFKQKLSSQ